MKPLKPWDINSFKKPSDDFTMPLWAPFKPGDFYFAIAQTKPIIIFIVPAEFWDKNAKTFWDSMPITHHLPNYLCEIFEGGYEVESDIDSGQVCKDLFIKGFQHNHHFQNYIDRNKTSGVRM